MTGIVGNNSINSLDLIRKNECNVTLLHSAIKPVYVKEKENGWIELDFTPGRNENEVEVELLKSIKESSEAKISKLAIS